MDTNSMSNITIAAVPQTLIEVIWDRVEELLQRVVNVSHGELTLELIKKNLIKGDYLLITIAKGKDIIAVNILEIRTFQSGIKALYIPITGGDDLDEWMPRFLELAEGIARDYRCTEMRGLAVRAGWLRKLKPYGWEPVHTVIRCPVEYGNEQVGEE